MLAGNASQRTILQPSVTLAAERGYRALNDPTPKLLSPGSIGSQEELDAPGKVISAQRHVNLPVSECRPPAGALEEDSNLRHFASNGR